jgi:hypothetical protein
MATSLAQYGKNTTFINVTSVVNDYLSAHDYMLVENSLFTDPCVGLYKELNIILPTSRLIKYREHSIISVLDFTDTSMTAISSVTYGKQSRYSNVTSSFKQYLTNNTQMRVENTIFGDPNRGVVKELRINLTNGVCFVFNEHAYLYRDDIVNMIHTCAYINTPYVRQVLYGKGNVFIDVTNTLKQYLTSHNQIQIENSIFTDPCPGVFKELQVTLISGLKLVYREHDMIQLVVS